MLTTRQLAVGLLTLAVSGCAQEQPPGQQPPEGPVALREHIGQKLTLHGRFSLLGKQAPFVLVGDEPVYLVADASFTWGGRYIGLEGREVTIAGVLKRFEPPRTATPIPDSVQQLPPYFFFEMRDTTISVADVERQQR
jgi:hypothetical protein